MYFCELLVLTLGVKLGVLESVRFPAVYRGKLRPSIVRMSIGHVCILFSFFRELFNTEFFNFRQQLQIEIPKSSFLRKSYAFAYLVANYKIRWVIMFLNKEIRARKMYKKKNWVKMYEKCFKKTK